MFFPKDSAKLTTMLSAKEIYLTIKENTVPPTIVDLSLFDDVTFIGTFDEKSFSIAKSKSFSNNLFSPVACGTYTPCDNGTDIQYEFRLRNTDKIALAISLAISLIIILILAINKFWLAGIALLVFEVVIYAVFVLIWHRSIKNFTEHFNKLFKQ